MPYKIGLRGTAPRQEQVTQHLILFAGECGRSRPKGCVGEILRFSPRVSYNSPMSRIFKTRTLQAWIACLAILFGSLAPSISHALAAASPGTARVEICTRAGIMMMTVSDTAAKKSPLSLTQAHLKHCPCCLAHEGPLGLPPPQLVTFAILGGHDLFPALFYVAPQPLFSWRAANPRAPPVLA
jgi:hypothetical protein